MAKKAKKTLEIGCYIDGGCRNITELNHDSLDICLDFLVAMKADKPLQVEIETYLNREALADDDETLADDEELAEDLLNSAIDTLSAYCADYTWIGFHESDFGVWISHDSIQEDIRFGELISRDDMPKAYTGLVIDVSDHGNMTLYKAVRGRLYEIWSCV